MSRPGVPGRDSRKATGRGEFELIARIDGRWMGEEVGGTMLQPLVQRQHKQAAIARAGAVQQAP